MTRWNLNILTDTALGAFTYPGCWFVGFGHLLQAGMFSGETGNNVGAMIFSHMGG